MRRPLMILGILATLALGAGATSAAAPPARGGFVSRITNPYMPLTSGSRWVYTGIKDGQSQRDVVTVTHGTKRILGIEATVVRDVATHGSTVLERTTDWFAQDVRGNVWYLGERTAAYENGQVDHSGSWQAGVDGARPGIVMTAHPQVGDTHRQEFLKGEAEDQYWLVDLAQRVRTPFVMTSHAVLTLEWTRLEPGVIDRKYYVRGIGLVAELSAQGPRETARLVQHTTG